MPIYVVYKDELKSGEWIKKVYMVTTSYSKAINALRIMPGNGSVYKFIDGEIGSEVQVAQKAKVPKWLRSTTIIPD